ncbi:hypothetical protein F4821DRAFT_253694 [Hypoxylon rubiginosum]|uniref:Uncharacterized protein n=1 Tax=Hypoxylon rubiginosum TaxID=110542 RepID=A0ACC0DJL9_9PEZI|nr:hypothetical protein F4821DRAFT_253694 [Hypoxylon rubiginosum]
MPTASSFPTKARIREIFAHLGTGDMASFYTHVADDVDWTVMGTHVLSGHHVDKESFLSNLRWGVEGVFEGPLKLHVTSIIGGDVEEWAVIEMVSEATCMVYDNRYSWSTRWKDGKIVEVRAYLDGLFLNRVLSENGSKAFIGH